MKFIKEELNLIQIIKIVGGVIGLCLLYAILQKIK